VLSVALLTLAYWGAVSSAVAAARQNATPLAEVHGMIIDEKGLPVPHAEIEIRFEDGSMIRALSDESGTVVVSNRQPGSLTVTVSKPGFYPLREVKVAVNPGINDLTFSLTRGGALHEEMDVTATTTSIQPDVISRTERLTASEIRETPVNASHVLRNAIATTPSVIQDSSGQLHVAGARPGDTQYVLDGFEIGDPVTGEFAARIDVDSVESVSVETGHPDARYAHAGVGVVNIETRRGDDQWRFGTTDFLPDFALRSGVHLGNWFPRVSTSGPLIKGRLWFSDGLSLQHSLAVFPDLPRKTNTSSATGADNLFKLAWKANNSHLLEGSFLWNGSKSTRVGMSRFSPVSTTTTDSGKHYVFSAKDQMSVGSVLVELGAAYDNAEDRRVPQGSGTYVLVPGGSRGNYFDNLNDHKNRWQWQGNGFLPARRALGTHDIRFGVKGDWVGFDREVHRSSINVLGPEQTLIRQSSFVGPDHFVVSNSQGGAYVQDSWHFARSLILQAGSRFDWDEKTAALAPMPSVALDWIPSPSGMTKLVTAFGVSSEQPQLALFARGLEQERIDLFFQPNLGNDPARLSRVRFSVPGGQLKHPVFHTVTVDWEQQWSSRTRYSLHWIRREQHNGLAYEIVSPTSADKFFQLKNSRSDRYQALQGTLVHTFSGRATVSVDYVRSAASSSKLFDYSIAQLDAGDQAAGRVSWDAPNRIVSHGSAQTHWWGLLLTYFFDYRTGFPFSVINADHAIVGPPNRLRFPAYATLNLAAEKQIKVFGREWAVRISALNATGRNNPSSVDNNADSPTFLALGGGQRRSITARLRLVGRT